MRRAIAIAGSIVAGIGSASGSDENLLNGTWQLDPQTIELKLFRGLFECRSCEPYFRVEADGVDHFVPRSGFDTMRATQIDERTVSVVGKRARNPISTIVMTAAADGATMHFQRRLAPPHEEPTEESVTLTRIEAGSPGAHAVSGRWSWPVVVDPTSFYVSGDTLVRKDSQGSSYTANLDGTDAPYVGRPGVTVSVKIVRGRTLVQKDKQDGKVFAVERFTVDDDNRTLHIRYEYPNGGSSKQTAHREASGTPVP